VVRWERNGQAGSFVESVLRKRGSLANVFASEERQSGWLASEVPLVACFERLFARFGPLSAWGAERLPRNARSLARFSRMRLSSRVSSRFLRVSGLSQRGVLNNCIGTRFRSPAR